MVIYQLYLIYETKKKKIHYDAIINAHWLIEIKNQNTIQRTLLEIESMKPANESDHDWIE